MMTCDNCGKRFDDKDGMMYVWGSELNQGPGGSPYIWLCNSCKPLFDDTSREAIWRKVHPEMYENRKRHWWER